MVHSYIVDILRKGNFHSFLKISAKSSFVQDLIENPQSLEMKLSVNGKVMQSGNSDKMIFSVYQVIHYLSHFMTLEEGDLILTGTPPGVGMGQNPQVYLKSGDVVELEIEDLGKQKQLCQNA